MYFLARLFAALVVTRHCVAAHPQDVRGSQEELAKDVIEEERIAWVDLPSFDGMAHSKEFPKTPNDTLPPGWLKNIANDGTYYYWNVKTREAQWDRP